MSRLRVVMILLATFLVASCASSALVTGRARPPIDPAQVRVYFAPPPGQYEEIALLESNSGSFTYGEQNKMNSVIAKLRKEAAKVGANGVLFRGTAEGGGNSAVSVGAGGGSYGGRGFSSGGVGLSISPTQKFAKGIAIYVENPPPPGEQPMQPPQAAPVTGERGDLQPYSQPYEPPPRR